MIKFIVFSVLLNTGEIQAFIPENIPEIQANRRRNKKGKGRRKGGFGLR